MNNVALLGNVVRDVEVSTFQKDGKESKLARFSLAVYRTKEKTDFVDINAFDWAAESAEKFALKGAKLAVVGSLQQDSWTDKDGNARTGHKVVAQRVYSTSKPATASESEATTADDDIPF